MASVSKAAVVHCRTIKSAQIGYTYTANNLINAYVRCRDFGAALKLFDEMPHRDTASWNTVIAGYVNSRNFQSAWDFLKSMKQHGLLFDGYTFGSILKCVAANGCLYFGLPVHTDVVKMGYEGNVYSTSALVDMYAKCGRMEDANKVFFHMPERNTVSWNALIAGYAEIGDRWNCFGLLEGMSRESVRLDDGTFCPLLTLLDDQEFYKLAMQLHAKIKKCRLDFESTVCNALISAYSKCGSIENAEKVFDEADSCRDLITWNSMLAAYIECDQGMETFGLFLEMERLGLEPDIYTFTSIISACYEITQKRQGKCLHALVIKRGLENVTSIANALIAMYLKSNGSYMDDAMKVFEFLDVKDSFSWNTILTGLSQNALGEISFKIFEEMRSQRLEMDHYAFAAVLRSCSDLATFRLGQQIHVLTLKTGVNVYEYVTSALIFMYSKCGHIEDAWKSFEESPKESSITWNSIIFAYAQHGQGEVALEFLSSMTKRKVKPDPVTFVAVLTACSHIGLVEEGRNFLNYMESDYGILPRMEHYACAIDLLGRAGHLEEAKELIQGMPFQPDSMVWKTLLGACRTCGDIELATEVAQRLLELEPGEHCTYVLLIDMFRKLKHWNEIASVKRLMRERGVKKIPGWSWIEVKNEVHAFNAEDHSHPHCMQIYGFLRKLMDEIKLFENGEHTNMLGIMNDWSIVGLNLPSYESGSNPWGHLKPDYLEERGFVETTADGGLLEIFGLKQGWHASMVMVELVSTKHIAQASAKEAYMQADGKLWKQPMNKDFSTFIEIKRVPFQSVSCIQSCCGNTKEQFVDAEIYVKQLIDLKNEQ